MTLNKISSELPQEKETQVLRYVKDIKLETIQPGSVDGVRRPSIPPLFLCFATTSPDTYAFIYCFATTGPDTDAFIYCFATAGPDTYAFIYCFPISDRDTGSLSPCLATVGRDIYAF